MNAMNATASITITAWARRRRMKASMRGWVRGVVSEQITCPESKGNVPSGLVRDGAAHEKGRPKAALNQSSQASRELERVLQAEGPSGVVGEGRVDAAGRHRVALTTVSDVEVHVGTLAERIVVAEAELADVAKRRSRRRAALLTTVTRLQRAGADRRQRAELPVLVGDLGCAGVQLGACVVQHWLDDAEVIVEGRVEQ